MIGMLNYLCIIVIKLLWKVHNIYPLPRAGKAMYITVAYLVVTPSIILFLTIVVVILRFNFVIYISYRFTAKI